MPDRKHILRFRVRYHEIDRMNTVYNSRVLEWFEHGRTEWLRSVGTPYSQMEARGVLLPLVEAHVEYLGRVGYDEELELTTTAAMAGKARLRFDMHIAHADGGKNVARGYTIHAITDPSMRPLRPPAWLLEAMGQA